MDLEKAYENAIIDEHYHREMFQKRLGYHTNVVLVSLGAVGAALLDAEGVWTYRLLGVALVFIGVFALVTPSMIQRIYEHFIEHLDIRERLEVALELRAPQAVANSTALAGRLGTRPSIAQPVTPSFTSGYLFHKSWICSGKGRSYFSWMKGVFYSLGGLAELAGISLLLASTCLELLPPTPDKPDVGVRSTPGIERTLGVVGPFGRSESCVTTPALDRQVAAIAERAHAAGARQIIVLGAADSLPVAATAGDAFGTNTGVALSRARCVAGWIAERLARHAIPSLIDVRVRVRDAVARTRLARISGSVDDRMVEVLMIER